MEVRYIYSYVESKPLNFPESDLTSSNVLLRVDEEVYSMLGQPWTEEIETMDDSPPGHRHWAYNSDNLWVAHMRHQVLFSFDRTGWKPEIREFKLQMSILGSLARSPRSWRIYAGQQACTFAASQAATSSLSHLTGSSSLILYQDRPILCGNALTLASRIYQRVPVIRTVGIGKDL